MNASTGVENSTNTIKDNSLVNNNECEIGSKIDDTELTK